MTFWAWVSITKYQMVEAFKEPKPRLTAGLENSGVSLVYLWSESRPILTKRKKSKYTSDSEMRQKSLKILLKPVT